MPGLTMSMLVRYFGAASLLGQLASGTSVAAKDGPVAVDAEVVLAVDVSFSMNDAEQHLQRAGYVAAIESPDFLQALKSNPLGKIAIAYIEWASASDQKVLVDWTLIEGPASARAFANRLAGAAVRRGHRTSISGGIEAAMRMF